MSDEKCRHGFNAKYCATCLCAKPEKTYQELEQENKTLREALKSLFPILQQWEPDYSSPEDRNAWRKAEAIAQNKE